jgi:hypothetical protein
MNLFIDAVSNTSILILFDSERNIINREEFIIK